MNEIQVMNQRALERNQLGQVGGILLVISRNLIGLKPFRMILMKLLRLLTLTAKQTNSEIQ